MSVRAALFYSYLEKYAGLVISIVLSIVMARLLTPEEIGVYSVSAVLVAVAGSVRDFGAGTYLVQVKELTAEKIRSAFTVALGVGVLFAVVLALLAEPIARFYRAPGTRDVVLLLALNFLIVPFGSITGALLSRDMRFRALGVIGVGYSITHAAVAITLALLGASYMSLAWAALAATIASALLSTLFRPKGLSWLPGLREVPRIMSFGGRTSVSAVISEVSNGIPDLIVGRAQGMAAAGLYGRAQGLVSLYQSGVMRAVWPVMLPYFSGAQRSGQRLKEHYVRATLLTTGVGWPFMAFTGTMAYPLIRVMFGDQWDEAVDPARLLCAAGAVNLIAIFGGHVLTAMGLVTRLMWLQVGMLPGKVLIVALGAMHGLEWLAASLILWAVIQAVTVHMAIRQPVGLGFRDYIPIAWRSGAAALAAGLPPLVLVAIFGARPTRILLVLLLGALGSGVAYLVALFLVKHPLAAEIQRVWTRYVTRSATRDRS